MPRKSDRKAARLETARLLFWQNGIAEKHIRQEQLSAEQQIDGMRKRDRNLITRLLYGFLRHGGDVTLCAGENGFAGAFVIELQV